MNPWYELYLYYTALTSVLVCALIVVAVIIGVVVSNSRSDICQTASCTEAAEYILNNIDTTFDPCKDFYSFSCANYEQQNIPPGRNLLNINFQCQSKIMIITL